MILGRFYKGYGTFADKEITMLSGAVN